MGFNFLKKHVAEQEQNIENNISLAKIMIKTLSSQMDITELASLFSDDLDKQILKAKAENLEYVGGIFSIFLENDEEFSLKYSLYFRDINKKLLTKEAASDKMSLEYLSESAIKDLKNSKKIEMEISEPESK